MFIAGLSKEMGGLCPQSLEVSKGFHQALFMVTFFFFFRVAYEGSQARGQIGAVAASLHHSHSNARSEPHTQSTPQLTAMLDP